MKLRAGSPIAATMAAKRWRCCGSESGEADTASRVPGAATEASSRAALAMTDSSRYTATPSKSISDGAASS